MIFLTTYDIGDNVRAFLYRRNRFERVLEPGRHRIMASPGKLKVETFDISAVYFEHAKARFLLSNQADKLSQYIDSVELGDKEVGLVYRNKRLERVLAPGSFFAYWKNVEAIRVDIIDIEDEYRIDDKLIALLGRGLKIGQSKEVYQALNYVEVPDEHIGLLEVNGKLEQTLVPGSYGFWLYNRSIKVKLLDLRLQTIDIAGQEILTKDRVSLRLNLSVSFKIDDPKLAVSKLSDINGFIYRELQLALREAVGTKTLDQLLEDKNSLNSVIRQGVDETLKSYGVNLLSVGVKDIVLPGDMKVILNRVVEAQKESEANLIKRREETQAMRSLHNTAKMMENNSVLMRLKELEALERVTDRIDNITVYGGLDGLLTDLVKLKTN